MPPPKGLATLFNPLLSSLGNRTSRVGLSSGRIELIGIQQQRQHFQCSTTTRTSAIDIVRLKQGRRNEATTRRRNFSSSTSIHRSPVFSSPSSPFRSIDSSTTLNRSLISQLHFRIRSISSTTSTPSTATTTIPTTTTTTTRTKVQEEQDEGGDLPRLTSPIVSKYLFLVAGMVFCIVIVGGMTRLTESGLSITEWNVISGMKLPLTSIEWEIEFEKYRKTPEWLINNQHITLRDFKRIYLWEWSHRMLGRLIGLTFLLPLPFFVWKKQLSKTALLPLLGIGTLIGGQGALGWYMVKSGLDSESVKDLGGVPRVSQYRLAAHLGMAFCVFALCLRMGFGVKRDWQLAKLGKSLSRVGGGVEQSLKMLESKTAGRLRIAVTLLSGLVFLTAFSGAFVAGLDAGLIYNEWPTMGGSSLSPGLGELYKDYYSRLEDKSDKWWRNMFENPTTAQFDHRMLAYTTFLSIVTLFGLTRRRSIQKELPPLTNRLIKASLHMSLLQVALGVSTLLYLVPTHLAATHQAGSLVLLTLVLGVGASLRRPGKVARQVLQIKALREKAAKL